MMVEAFGHESPFLRERTTEDTTQGLVATSCSHDHSLYTTTRYTRPLATRPFLQDLVIFKVSSSLHPNISLPTTSDSHPCASFRHSLCCTNDHNDYNDYNDYNDSRTPITFNMTPCRPIAPPHLANIPNLASFASKLKTQTIPTSLSLAHPPRKKNNPFL